MYYNNLANEIACWYIDQCVLSFIKMYYWPMFLAGSGDDFVDLLKPQTYSICK